MSDQLSIEKLFMAVRCGNIEHVATMLNEDNKININQTRWSGFSMLHRAASLGYTDICELLISHGALVNLKSVRGWYTPLHLAVANGYTDTALFLIDKGAFPWAKSKYNEDPFVYGIKRGFKKNSEDLRSRVVRKDMTTSIRRAKELMDQKTNYKH